MSSSIVKRIFFAPFEDSGLEDRMVQQVVARLLFLSRSAGVDGACDRDTLNSSMVCIFLV